MSYSTRNLLSFASGFAAQVMFAPFVWAAARHINRPLDGWRKILPEGIRPALSKLWLVTLALGSTSFLIGLCIAITGTSSAWAIRMLSSTSAGRLSSSVGWDCT